MRTARLTVSSTPTTGIVSHVKRIYFYFFNSFVPRAPNTVPGIFTLFTIFGRMPGIAPELLQPQPGVLPMSYTHPYGFLLILINVQ